MTKKTTTAKMKDIGLGLPEPKETCQDPKCAWHGKLPVRGRVFEGTVRSAKTKNTVIIEWGYNRFVKKYERFEKRKSRIVAYNPPCMKAKEGDYATAAECRPLSKTKSFVVVNVRRGSA